MTILWQQGSVKLNDGSVWPNDYNKEEKNRFSIQFRNCWNEGSFESIGVCAWVVLWSFPMGSRCCGWMLHPNRWKQMMVIRANQLLPLYFTSTEGRPQLWRSVTVSRKECSWCQTDIWNSGEFLVRHRTDHACRWVVKSRYASLKLQKPFFSESDSVLFLFFNILKQHFPSCVDLQSSRVINNPTARAWKQLMQPQSNSPVKKSVRLWAPQGPVCSPELNWRSNLRGWSCPGYIHVLEAGTCRDICALFMLHPACMCSRTKPSACKTNMRVSVWDQCNDNKV